MKTSNKILGALIGIMLSVPVLAQNEDIFNDQQNDRIRTVLDKQYSNIDHNSITWKQNNEGLYEGSFTYQDRDLTTTFDRDGRWMTTSERMAMDDLPTTVRDNIGQNYKQAEINEINRISTNDDQTYYDITIRGQEPKRFDVTGTPIEQ